MVMLGSATAEAQRVRPADVERLLSSEDQSEVQQGIESIGLSGNPRFVPLLAARIRQGLPLELLETAVDTLGVLGRAEAGDVLFLLATHRREVIRQKAVDAIVGSRPRGAEAVLVSALSDQSPAVRSAAAVGLGQLGARGSTDALFHALDRNILEASMALGQVVSAAEVARVLGYIGQLPFDVVMPALNEILARADLPLERKLEVIAQVAELATPEVRQFLVDVQDALPDDRQGRPLREAAAAAAERIVQ
jgi:HEAT repeat protein